MTSSTSPAGPPVQVAVLAFPEATASMIYGLCDLFRSAGRDWGMVVGGEPGPALIDPQVVTADGAPLTIANGVSLVPDAAIAALPAPAVICVPELLVSPSDPLAGRFGPEIDWLRAAYAAGATIATACSGAVLLAMAGLLDGEDATTHWAYCDSLAQRYPKVRVHRQRSLVTAGDGGRLVMAGGGTSWQDLGLYLIARAAGIEAAMQVARLYLIDWHHGGQQPFARLAATRQSEDALITRIQLWVADNYADARPVAAMQKLSALPERSFERRFRKATGMSPLEYVHTVRLEEAKQLLESTDRPVEAIAQDVGYEDASFFARLFRRRVNLTPAQYRRRFGGLREVLRSAHA